MEPSKRDWKLFREKIAGWQEAYMGKLLKEYIDLLNGDAQASSKFWALEKRIKEDKKKPGVIIEMRKREMVYDIVQLLDDGAITMEELSDFSDELKENINYLQERRGNSKR